MDHVEGETTINPPSTRIGSRGKAEITTYPSVRVYIPDENRKRKPRTELAIINRAQRCATRVLLTDMVGAKKKERDREKKREEENSRGRRTRGSLRALGVGQGFIGYVNAAKLRGSHPRDTVVHLKRMIFLHVRRVVTRKEQFRQAAISVWRTINREWVRHRWHHHHHRFFTSASRPTDFPPSFLLLFPPWSTGIYVSYIRSSSSSFHEIVAIHPWSG